MLVTACRGHAPWTPWYACLIPVLVLMFNPSFGTHFSSQFWYTSFIQIINVILRPGLITQHSLHSAMPCQGQAPGPPSTHFLFLFWYTCLISLLLVMFYLSYQTYTLACTNGMALTVLSHAFPGASPWAPQYTCSTPVLVHMFNLRFSIYVLLKLSKLHFNLDQWHGTHCTQPACQGQAPWTSQF